MAIKFNRSQTFATNGTVTAAGLHNLIDGTDIYQALITDQTAMTSVGSLDKLLIADSDLTAGDAPRSVTVNELFEDALTLSTYTNVNTTNLKYTSATGNYTLSTGATITNGTIASGTIPTLTAGTTTSTAANITNGTVQTLTASTASISQGSAILTQGTIATLNSTTGTIATLNSTTGTIATLNSTTGTIATLNSTTGTIATLNSTTGTIGTLVATGTITGSTNVVNIGSGQIYKDASGNVGIGTTTPSGKLDVYDATSSILNVLGNSTVQAVVYKGSSDTTAPILTFRKSRGSVESPTAVATGDQIGNINFQAFGGTNNRGICRIISNVEAYVSDSDISSNLTFVTSPAGGVTTTERLRITAAGNVGIGTATPSAQLELSTDSAKKPSTNTWTITSDQRLKTNITNADNDRCYEIVKQVPLKRYTWKSEVYSQEQVKDRSKLGWIAQDVEEVFPKAVGTSRFVYNQVFEDVVIPELDSKGNAILNKDGVAETRTEKRLVSEDVIEDCKDLNSDQIYAAMYGTIQKLIEKVEFLESKVAALEAA